jgi:hypothetical protein
MKFNKELEKLRNENRLLYRYIRGSHLYGLNVETSDVDTSGVFVCDAKVPLGLGFDYKTLIHDPKSDNVLYEIGEYLRLLIKSNPTMVESLFVPNGLIIGEVDKMFKPVLANKEQFLSKKLFNSLFGYATQQIHKARGLGKKMMNPITERKGILDFCYVLGNGGSYPLKDLLEKYNMDQCRCGLVNIQNARGIYALYYDVEGSLGYSGCVNEDETSTQLRLSSIPKGEEPLCYISYNEDGFVCHCKEYREYNEWKENRNPIRYESNLDKNYDAKNMMHCVRLLHMGIEIAKGEGFNVRRTKDRAFLLGIRNHKMEYDELLSYVDEKKKEFDEAIKTSTLREEVDPTFVNDLLIEIRKEKIIEFFF